MTKVHKLTSTAPVPDMRFLVVDDDRVTNRVLQMQLRTLGYQVDVATSGEEALTRLNAAPPDLIFLDISMPGMSGLEVLECIRSQNLDLAVIMTTAFGSEQVAIDALRHGADDYLRKPFDTHEFKAVLQRTVTQLELRRQNVALRHQLEIELMRAAEIQADLLPSEVPPLPGFELAARCVPAREVGGDFYDWQTPLPGILTLSLCDVMGKGMPAALMMATVRAVMRSVVRKSAPVEAIKDIGAALDQDLDRAGQFVTLFLAQLDSAARCLTFVDAGHGHVVLRRADGTLQQLQPRGLPLGVLPDQHYQQGQLVFNPDDMLIVYSDGLVDARPDLSIDQHVLATQLCGVSDAEETVNRLIDLAMLHGPPPDDLTVVVLWCRGVA